RRHTSFSRDWSSDVCSSDLDGVANVDIGALLAFHRSNAKTATVTAVRPPGRFGELRMDDGLVRDFNEKPQASEGFINGGFMVFRSEERRVGKECRSGRGRGE